MKRLLLFFCIGSSLIQCAQPDNDKLNGVVSRMIILGLTAHKAEQLIQWHEQTGEPFSDGQEVWVREKLLNKTRETLTTLREEFDALKVDRNQESIIAIVKQEMTEQVRTTVGKKIGKTVDYQTIEPIVTQVVSQCDENCLSEVDPEALVHVEAKVSRRIYDKLDKKSSKCLCF